MIVGLLPPRGVKPVFTPFSPVDHCPFLIPSWALCTIILSLLMVWPPPLAERSSEMHSSWQNKAKSSRGVIPAPIFQDRWWRNNKIQLHLSFPPRIMNSRILSLCPAPTGILWKRCPSPKETSLPRDIKPAHVCASSRAQRLTNIFQPNVLSF